MRKPTTHPRRPRQVSVCIVFSLRARPENAHRILPPIAARFRHVSLPDRIAMHYVPCKPDRLSVVAKCRRFQHVPPTALGNPGLSAPVRNARQPSAAVSSQAVGQHRFAVQASRCAAACRLSQSAPESWPCYPSTKPAHRLPQPTPRRIVRLLPRRPRGILRSRSAATPQPTPTKRRAIFINQSDIKPNKDPITPETCLTLRFTSVQPGKVCANAHLIL